MYANRLKTNLDSIISETQSGFLKGRHISNNIRLVLDLLDCADSVHSNSLIIFLDFYKAFDTIEHQFLLKSLKLFGFGDAFVDTIAKFYNESIALLLYILIPLIDLIYCVVLGRAAQFLLFYLY